MPHGYAEDPLLSEAVDRLASAVADRTGSRPTIASDGRADFAVTEDAEIPAGQDPAAVRRDRGPWTSGLLGALGLMLVGIATRMLGLGALMVASGLEAALTTFNALLPLGLSRILGITAHLGIPTEIPMCVLALGGLLSVGGLLLGAARRPKAPA